MAARALVDLGPRAVLLKGGHARGRKSVDWLATPDTVFELGTTRHTGPKIHGTGCVLSALITAKLAARKLSVSRVTDRILADVCIAARARFDVAFRKPIKVGRGQWVLAQV